MNAGRRILIPEVAQILGVSERTIRRLIAARQLGTERILGTVGVPEAELAKFRAACFTPATVELAPRRQPSPKNLDDLVDGAVRKVRGAR